MENITHFTENHGELLSFWRNYAIEKSSNGLFYGYDERNTPIIYDENKSAYFGLENGHWGMLDPYTYMVDFKNFEEFQKVFSLEIIQSYLKYQEEIRKGREKLSVKNSSKINEVLSDDSNKL
ncbi:hypothetical protein AGMMS50249_3640 [candidate division SR1 bacterium]|nr:hypothetical protein AGMMS50249_3640 [candidate division SR1 bacterium]